LYCWTLIISRFRVLCSRWSGGLADCVLHVSRAIVQHPHCFEKDRRLISRGIRPIAAHFSPSFDWILETTPLSSFLEGVGWKLCKTLLFLTRGAGSFELAAIRKLLLFWDLFDRWKRFLAEVIQFMIRLEWNNHNYNSVSGNRNYILSTR